MYRLVYLSWLSLDEYLALFLPYNKIIDNYFLLNLKRSTENVLH